MVNSSLFLPAGRPDVVLKSLPASSGGAAAGQELYLIGDWSVSTLREVEPKLKELVAQVSSPSVTIETDGAARLDTGAIFVLWTAAASLEKRDVRVTIHAADPARQALIAEIKGKGLTTCPAPAHGAIYLTLNLLGARIFEQLHVTLQMLSFSGEVFTVLFRSILDPRRIRFAALVNQMQSTGILALPIVALLTFLIGLVTMYMGVQQLARLGGQEFAINLLEISVMREMAPLLTAIVIAGRSGSAFTAQIGSMIANEELAAMRTMGFSPMEFLVLPRLIALLLMVPLLTVLADFAAILGGYVAATMTLDMDFSAFMIRFHQVATLRNFLVGVIKAPFFAIAIAFIGCLQGYRVKKSAESVGQCTTEAVVESLFLVILLDALFALFFASIHL